MSNPDLMRSVGDNGAAGMFKDGMETAITLQHDDEKSSFGKKGNKTAPVEGGKDHQEKNGRLVNGESLLIKRKKKKLKHKKSLLLHKNRPLHKQRWRF